MLHEIFAPKLRDQADTGLTIEGLKKEVGSLVGEGENENEINLVSKAECINKIIELTKYAFSHRIYNIFYEDEFRYEISAT